MEKNEFAHRSEHKMVKQQRTYPEEVLQSLLRSQPTWPLQNLLLDLYRELRCLLANTSKGHAAKSHSWELGGSNMAIRI